MEGRAKSDESPKAKVSRGRPRRYAKFEAFEAGLPRNMSKRPAYCDGVGLFNGARDSTVWVKIRLPRGGVHRGRSIPAGGTVEIKLGHRSSWDWPQLVAERDRLQGLADRGEPLEAVQVPTFAVYAAEWVERRKATRKSYAVDKGNIRTALNPAFGKKALDAINVSDVNRWIGNQSAKLKPASVRRHLAVFNSIMNDAVRVGLIERNPAARADRVRGVEPRQRFVTEPEWRTVLDAADRIEAEQEQKKAAKPQQIRGWLRHYVVWAYNSGMRRAEILNLTWEDVRQLEDGITVVLVGNTKTGNPRTVTCTAEMKEILLGLAALPRIDGDNRLFPLSMTTLKRALTRLWRETGLVDIRLHDLRRSHATILVQRGVNFHTVAKRLGNSAEVMVKHYAVHLGDLEAVEAFDRPAKARSEEATAKGLRKRKAR